MATQRSTGEEAYAREPTEVEQFDVLADLEMEGFERLRGHGLTDRERDRIREGLLHQRLRGDALDCATALREATETHAAQLRAERKADHGERVFDHDNRNDRVAWMVERARDRERAATVGEIREFDDIEGDPKQAIEYHTALASGEWEELPDDEAPEEAE